MAYSRVKVANAILGTGKAVSASASYGHTHAGSTCRLQSRISRTRVSGHELYGRQE